MSTTEIFPLCCCFVKLYRLLSLSCFNTNTCCVSPTSSNSHNKSLCTDYHLHAVLFMSPYIIVKIFLAFIPSENCYLISYTNLLAMIYAVVLAFGIQLGFVTFIYLRLLVFVHYTVMQSAR